MSAHIYGNELADYIIGVITDHLVSPLGLKVVAKGDVRMLPGPDDLAGWLDAVLVRPLRVPLRHGDTIQSIGADYEFQLVYLRRCAENEEVVEVDISRAQQIAEAFLANPAMTDYIRPDGLNIYDLMPGAIEYDNAYADGYEGLDLRIRAITIPITIRTRARRLV